MLHNINAYAMDKGFSSLVLQKIYKSNINRVSLDSSEINNSELICEIEPLDDIIGNHIHLSLEREGKLDDLIQQHNDLFEKAKTFRRGQTTTTTKVVQLFICLMFVNILFAILCAFHNWGGTII